MKRKGKAATQEEAPDNTAPDVVRFMAKGKEVKGGKAK